MTMKQHVRKFRIKRVPPALSPSTGPVSVKPVPEQMTQQPVSAQNEHTQPTHQQTEPAQVSDSQKGLTSKQPSDTDSGRDDT